MHSEYYETLLHKHLAGELSDEEQATFDAWLDSAPDHRQRLEEAERIWTLTATAGSDLNINLDHEISRFKQTIQQSDNTVRKTPIYSMRLLRIATAAAVIFGGIILLLRGNPDWLGQDLVVEYTEMGEIKEIVLPDLSTVWLHENSQLSYDPDFANRDVILSGEGFFEVTHDPSNPFDIQSGEGQIQVLGTSFSVRNRPDDDQISVTVATGRVAFSSVATGQQEVLEAGYRGILKKSNNGLSKQPNDNPDFLAWQNRTLIFNETSFDAAVDMLRAHFAIVIEPPDAALAACTLTGEIESATLEEVIDLLSFSLGVDVAENQGVYAFTGTGCSQ